MLPESVLKKAADEMLDYQGSGQSVMEMSHRSKTYQAIIDSCSSLLREVMNIPEDYEILFLQGGASSQFAMVPLNLATKSGSADFVITGQWGKKAYSEAKKLIKAREVASSADKTFTYIPELDPETFDKNADYFHICYNNTIYGTRFVELPDTGDVPLVADMSSCILSEPIDVKKFGLIYAGAQKNMGPAGLTVVIIRKDLIGEPREGTPTMFTYKIHAENGSMYNTPPCWCIYILGLVLDWLESKGGIPGMEAIKHSKAQMLYDVIDNSKLFTCAVEPGSRSDMNVVFRTGNDELDAKFVKESVEAGFTNLKGHRSVGGMRASIYNAMPTEGVEKLCDFIKAFDKNN